MSVKKRAKIIGAVIGVVTLICLGTVIAMLCNQTGGTFAYVYQDNEVLHKINLLKVEEPYEIRIDAKGGGYNVIRVEKGKIGVVEASCPDLLCKNIGFISGSLIPITCLPNHMVIVVTTDESPDNGLDGIAY